MGCYVKEDRETIYASSSEEAGVGNYQKMKTLVENPEIGIHSHPEILGLKVRED